MYIDECNWTYSTHALKKGHVYLISFFVHVHIQLGGAVTEKPLNMGILLKKRVSLICSTLRARSLDYKHRLIQEVNDECIMRLDSCGGLGQVQGGWT